MSSHSAVDPSSNDSGSQPEVGSTVALVPSKTTPQHFSVKSRPSQLALGIGRLVWMAVWLLLGVGLLVESWRASPPHTRSTLDMPKVSAESALTATAQPKSGRAATNWRRIEEIRVGQRVLGRNPLGVGARLGAEEPGDEPDPKTWRQVNLRLVKSNGRLLYAVLLRRVSWLEANQVQVGGKIQLNMPEMGAVGQAQVLAIERCPEVESGAGQVVTATFCHEPDDNILDVWVGDQHKPIGVTDTHPWWSEDRQAFVAVGKMQVGERVWTHGLGVVPISKIAKRAREAWVYNLEVQGEHVYEVSALGVLVHNMNSDGKSKTNNAGSQGTPSEGASGTPAETGQSPPSNAPSAPNDKPGITRSEHATIRSRQGRPVGQVVNDVQRAGPKDVFVQPDDGRFVVRGPNGREHIIEPNGEHVTSVNRPNAAHQGRLRDGTIRPATEDELQKLKDFVK